MPSLNLSPTSLESCQLFKIVQSSDDLRGKVCTLVNKTVTPLKSIRAGPFKQFTVHDDTHSLKLLGIMAGVCQQRTLEELSALEAAVLIMSAYLHDVGLALPEEKRQRILLGSQFTELLEEQGMKTLIDQAVAKGTPQALDLVHELQQVALGMLLRPRHALPEVYKEFMKSIDSSGEVFTYKGVSFRSYLAEICASHGEDAFALMAGTSVHEKRFPRDLTLSGLRLNAQFCAALLRVSDILDFDRERAPESLFEILAIARRDLPGASETLLEWLKQSAIHDINIREDEIVVSAECKHPIVEAAIRRFLPGVEKEIRDTSSVIRDNPVDIARRYQLVLPQVIRLKVSAMGYVFKDMSFRLDQPSIMNLLVGSRPYPHPGVPVRELIQNSLDACAVREALTRESGYEPQITVGSTQDSSGRQWLEVADNGVGMDEHVLTNYFFTVGKRYYESPEFRRLMQDNPFSPISRFGVGAVSSFLIADAMTVETCNPMSPRNDYKARVLTVEGRGALAFVTEATGEPQGTKVKIRLASDTGQAESTYRSIRKYLEQVVVRPRYPVTVRLGSQPELRLGPSTFFAVSQEVVECLQSQGYAVLSLRIDRPHLAARAFLLLADAGKRSPVPYQRDTGLEPVACTSGISPGHSLTNRLTLGGFLMSVQEDFFDVLYIGGQARHTLFLDVDVRTTADIEFDIARTRAWGKGLDRVRHELNNAVVQDLRTRGHLDESTYQRLVRKRSPRATLAEHDDSVIAEVIRVLTREPRWHKGIHKEIAEELKLSHSAVGRIINDLIHQGYVSRPA